LIEEIAQMKKKLDDQKKAQHQMEQKGDAEL
jgi:hypothetical protein